LFANLAGASTENGPGAAILVANGIHLLKKYKAKMPNLRINAEKVDISGEESTGQVRRRAKRLGVSQHPVNLASETSMGPILDGLINQT